MEYVIAPVLAIIVSLKFTHFTDAKRKSEIKALQIKVEKLEATVELIDKQTLQKMITTLQPVSSSIRELQEFVGVR